MFRVLSRTAGLALMCLALPGLADAWVYPEHRAITADGIKQLSLQQAQLLTLMWADARVGHEARLCAQPSEGNQGLHPLCIDFAAWTAIAGDHSCSATILLHNVLDTDWILAVARVTAELDAKLAVAKSDAQRAWPLTKCDQLLERADPAYSSRAGSGAAHFLLYRTKSSRDLQAYMTEALSPGAPPNALGVYLIYHGAALRLATAWGDPATPAPARPDLAREALAAEGFALHFLADAFAAGHAAGLWGGVAERKGTHDYYNLHGLETRDWNNDPFILFGDGYLRPDGLEQAASVVVISLAQFLEASVPSSRAALAVARLELPDAHRGASFDVCRAERMPAQMFYEDARPLLAETLPYTPVPSLGPGPASLPRHRADIGGFIALAGGGWIGANERPTSPFTRADAASLLLATRVGVGLESLAGPAGDGQLWLQAGLSTRNSENFVCRVSCGDAPAGSLLGIPSRFGFAMRLRIPFWLVPGDLLLASPVLALIAPKSLERMAITAVNGGVIPWQAGLPSPVGRFQFILGREVGFTLYGYLRGPDAVTIFPPIPGGFGAPVAYQMKSTEWEFPIVEWRLFHAFSGKQASSVVLQLGAGIERTTRLKSALDDGLPSKVDKRYLVFLRVGFDGRQYF